MAGKIGAEIKSFCKHLAECLAAEIAECGQRVKRKALNKSVIKARNGKT